MGLTDLLEVDLVVLGLLTEVCLAGIIGGSGREKGFVLKVINQILTLLLYYLLLKLTNQNLARVSFVSIS